MSKILTMDSQGLPPGRLYVRGDVVSCKPKFNGYGSQNLRLDAGHRREYVLVDERPSDRMDKYLKLHMLGLLKETNYNCAKIAVDNPGEDPTGPYAQTSAVISMATSMHKIHIQMYKGRLKDDHLDQISKALFSQFQPKPNATGGIAGPPGNMFALRLDGALETFIIVGTEHLAKGGVPVLGVPMEGLSIENGEYIGADPIPLNRRMVQASATYRGKIPPGNTESLLATVRKNYGLDYLQPAAP